MAGATHHSFQCSRCQRGVSNPQTDRLFAEHGLDSRDVSRYNIRVLCDECALIASKRKRWLEVVVSVLLLIGLLALFIGRVLG